MSARPNQQLLKLLELDFVRFCIVGGTGFVINFILLSVLRNVFGVNVFISQLVSSEIALFSNFMLHHHWTYKAHKVEKTMRRLILQFHMTSWPAIIGSTAMVGVAEKILHLDNLEALAISSVVVLAWNYAWSKYVIWKDISVTDIKDQTSR